MLAERQRATTIIYKITGVMRFTTLLIVTIVIDGTMGETPYHYVSQIQSTPRTVSPKPLFSPHDVRREGNGRNGVSDDGRALGYGTKLVGTGTTSGHNLVYSDPAVYGDIWYPLNTDIQYSGIGLSEIPYVLSYGSLPEGYEPIIPLRGDPNGYSFSYQAGDHTRQESSDGRGNYYSSFSFIPPASNVGQRPLQAPPEYNVVSTRQPPTVNIPSRRPSTYPSTTFSTRKPSTSNPLFIPSHNSRAFDQPTAKPLVSPNSNDFENGYYFESKKLFTTRVPQTSYTPSHALSTNIKYNNFDREPYSRSKPKIISSGARSLTIEPPSAPKDTTERSYQSLSRSLPLAFASQRLSTTPPSQLNPSTVKPYSTSNPRRSDENRSRQGIESRSSLRRSTTENTSILGPQRSTSSIPSTTARKPSVIQKIPRKTKTTTEESPQRPYYIDDLTSLAYSDDKDKPKNNTIMQYKPINNKIRSDSINEENLILNGTDHIHGKDGYITGNKTFIGGLGLRSNIHY